MKDNQVVDRCMWLNFVQSINHREVEPSNVLRDRHAMLPINEAWLWLILARETSIFSSIIGQS